MVYLYNFVVNVCLLNRIKMLMIMCYRYIFYKVHVHLQQ